ncbi:hypothetical protein [Bhargavaea massiliensis]|uniref:hypothetical protein n=1 Tax=Bhargavaea massiliensis TaxID=2697500 RepID=UPI001BCB42AA|nr:hypothetical protein [Bhargavaea massiliensis]
MKLASGMTKPEEGMTKLSRLFSNLLTTVTRRYFSNQLLRFQSSFIPFPKPNDETIRPNDETSWINDETDWTNDETNPGYYQTNPDDAVPSLAQSHPPCHASPKK